MIVRSGVADWQREVSKHRNGRLDRASPADRLSGSSDFGPAPVWELHLLVWALFVSCGEKWDGHFWTSIFDNMVEICESVSFG